MNIFDGLLSGDPLGQDDTPPQVKNLLYRIMSNPTGTETTQAMRGDAPFQPAAFVGGQPVTQKYGDLFNTAMTMGLGMSPGILAGAGAKTANLGKMFNAASDLSQGVHPAQVWQDHGWELGADQRWKFEIPDTNASLNVLAVTPNQYSSNLVSLAKPAGFSPKSTEMSLGDLLDHSELFKAYPQLADMPVAHMPLGSSLAGIKGAYAHPTSEFPVGYMHLAGQTPDALLSTVLHETQHAVQDQEGFARGGSSDEFLPVGHDVFKKDLADRRAEIGQMVSANGLDFQDAYLAYKYPNAHPQLQNSLGDDARTALGEYIAQENLIRTTEKNAFDQYKDLSGEVEARNVQYRHRNMDPVELAGQRPGGTADTFVKDQIIKFQNDNKSFPLDSKMMNDSEARKKILELRQKGWTSDGNMISPPPVNGAE